MNATVDFDPAASKAKKSANPPPRGRATYSGPTTFFLKTEKELEKDTHRGRRQSRSSASLEHSADNTPGDSAFGVQSLEETINSTFASESSLSRTSSNSSDIHSAHAMGDEPVTKKRRSGNRVHPSIIATGHRILSSDQSSSIASPLLADSPPRDISTRRGSVTSHTNMSQPLTPIKFSPHPESTAPSEPRSGSPKSFRLSDEEGSLADDIQSQAVMSSSGDEEDPGSRAKITPQLVMPSLSMPVRRPFTELGRAMGRVKLLVVGPRRVGKTSFIRSLFQSCEHIVHVDQPLHSIPTQSSFTTESSHYVPTTLFTEVQASSRPYPAWWTDFESRRMLHRRSSIGEGLVLERNLTFIDSPGIEDDSQVRLLLNHVKASLSRTARIESMSDVELVNLLSGDGGVQIDAVIYLFDPELAPPSSTLPLGLTAEHLEVLQYLSSWTNLIPVIGRSDTVSADTLCSRKNQIRDALKALEIQPYPLIDTGANDRFEALAISSASEDDADEVDASVLMSSQYLKPLVPSDLGQLINSLLAPQNIPRMRHLSATKFLLWRQQHLGQHINVEKQKLSQSPPSDQISRAPSTGSLLEEPSKVLVPYSASSYYRSASTAPSDASALSGHGLDTSAFALAKYNEQMQTHVPFRQVRLARWAQELQRSLDNERRKYHDFYSMQPSGLPSSHNEKAEHALVAVKNGDRPGQGRLGGDLGVIDPQDPLGVLAFGQSFKRQGFFVLQIAGSCGLLGAMMFWAVKHWNDVQEFLGFTTPPSTVIAAIPPPINKPALSKWLDDVSIRGFLGWCS